LETVVAAGFDSAAVENIGDIMSVEALISTQVIDTTSVGRSIMTAADAASVRTAADAQVTLVSGTNIKTVNSTSLLGSGDIAVGVSGTGAVDNAALRADGTGGATLQSSAFVIADNATASPNNTVNHASIAVTGGTTNVSVSIVPKGSGSFSLQVPDGTATGGNARGANAVDLQAVRSAATQVASGASSFCSGQYNTASGAYSTAVGYSNTSGQGSLTSGFGNSVTGNYNGAIGLSNTVSGGDNGGCFASGNYNSINVGTNLTAFVTGRLCSVTANAGFAHGIYGSSTRINQYSHGGDFGFVAGVLGGSQYVRLLAGGKTTSTTPVNLLLDSSTTRLTIPSGKTMSGFLIVKGIKSDGSAKARFVRLCDITNVGGTTALDTPVEAIGTDYNPSGCTLAVTAENATDDLQVNITGPAGETWRWVAVVEGLEIAYGT
jgi:hypothetical protein